MLAMTTSKFVFLLQFPLASPQLSNIFSRRRRRGGTRRRRVLRAPTSRRSSASARRRRRGGRGRRRRLRLLPLAADEVVSLLVADFAVGVHARGFAVFVFAFLEFVLTSMFFSVFSRG